MRTILVHLNVEAPDDDRSADAIADAITDALEIGATDFTRDLQIVCPLAEDI